MYKYDIHVHTSETSCCGLMSAAETVERYRASGYTGLCFTDHYSSSTFERASGSWRDKADRFLSGYRAAKKVADGLDILLGAELHFGRPGEHIYSSNDYLVYGITEEFIYAYPELHLLTLPEFSEIAKKHDLLVIQAHPMRNNMELVHLDLLDGMEVYNGNQNHEARNEKAEAFARARGYILTSGSDCHEEKHVGRGGILCSRRLSSSADLKALLRSGEYELIKTI
ncbi:MAG: PHP domain-containing protein [Oscillospiraceae bacterium]|nr:PHP domain-containing protein [Oscillospiraceae bacterium]